MNIFKKGSAVIGSALCMLIIVGYVNYEYNSEREKNLGKTVYVSTNNGEVIKVTSDKEEKNQYIFASPSVNDDILKIKENTINLQNTFESKGYNTFVTYNVAQGKYYIYTDNNDIEIIKDEAKSILNVEETEIVVNLY